MILETFIRQWKSIVSDSGDIPVGSDGLHQQEHLLRLMEQAVNNQGGIAPPRSLTYNERYVKLAEEWASVSGVGMSWNDRVVAALASGSGGSVIRENPESEYSSSNNGYEDWFSRLIPIGAWRIHARITYNRPVGNFNVATTFGGVLDSCRGVRNVDVFVGLVTTLADAQTYGAGSRTIYYWWDCEVTTAGLLTVRMNPANSALTGTVAGSFIEYSPGIAI